MVDTVTARLSAYTAHGRLDVITPAVRCLEDCMKSVDGCRVAGRLGNLRVTATPDALTVTNSLCKWYHGDNLRTLSRDDIAGAVECLSNTLHLPMGDADVSRLDVGCNMEVPSPVLSYLNALGELCRYSRRQDFDGSLYYKQNEKELAFYDKLDEMKGCTIPPGLENVLRYELRYKRHVPRCMKRPMLTLSDLSAPDVYRAMVDGWESEFKKIRGTKNNLIMAKQIMSKEFDLMGRIALIDHFGGLESTLKIVDDNRRAGIITTAYEASKLKRKIREAWHSAGELDDSNPLYAELRKTIRNKADSMRGENC